MQWPLQQTCCIHVHEIWPKTLPSAQKSGLFAQIEQSSPKAAQVLPPLVHCPLEQPALPPHTLKQAPQLSGSEVTSMQVPVIPEKIKQQSWVTGFGQSFLDVHAMPEHEPFTHMAPVGHV